MFVARVCVVLVAACASAGDPQVQDARPSDDSGSGGDGSGGLRACPAGQLAVNIGAGREVVCAAIDGPMQAALEARCSIYAGQRDNCDGCTAPPAKWGYAGGTCMNGLGADSNCTMPNLGGAAVQAFGLNLDGDVNGDDNLYTGLHCVTVAPVETQAPCKPGEFVASNTGMCRPLASAVVDYVRDSCSLYFGWQDSCDGCTSPPTKWGYTGDHGCVNGAGADNACVTATLGDQTIQLFGLNPDGDVDGNDKLHIGLHCAAPEPAGETTTGPCLPGQFVTGAGAADVRCDSQAPAIAAYVSAHCSIYFGWRDGCAGCIDPPAKWGSARVGACSNGAGLDNTCSKLTLGGQAVDMFGLNPDGDVDDNDMLYVDLQCR